jgi:hypothetical protein
MDHFAGLDVSVKETSICIVDSLKVLDPEWPIREADSSRTSLVVRFAPIAEARVRFGAKFVGNRPGSGNASEKAFHRARSTLLRISRTQIRRLFTPERAVFDVDDPVGKSE